MKHLDLFSGIGGFSLAFDTVFNEQENTHIFCEIDPFCQAVLRKHWPQAEICSDIKTFTNPRSQKQRGISDVEGADVSPARDGDRAFLLTGGFPCQPFSQAGRRKGTGDDRYLWPEMFEVIQDWCPTWIIAENVRGLVTWNDGMVLETVCADLEREGYEVQPLIIPAVAVGAPHRRDRIWFVANRKEAKCKPAWGTLPRGKGFTDSPWNQDWHEVAASLCRMDDGLPAKLDGLNLSRSGHRKARLKSLGNAIVPQVAMEIMHAIKKTI